MLNTSIRLWNESSGKKQRKQAVRCYGGGWLEGTASLLSGLAVLNVYFEDQL